MQNTANSSALTQSWLIEETKRLIMKFSAPIYGPTYLYQVFRVGHASIPTAKERLHILSITIYFRITMHVHSTHPSLSM